MIFIRFVELNTIFTAKKRMALAAAEMSDGKLSKKAKKLAEASEGHQKNTMLNFVKPSTAKPVAKPAMSSKFV